MSGAVGGVNMELFEAYFRRADMNQDGKISGAEAVAFLQGSNLPKQVLAQVPLFSFLFFFFHKSVIFSEFSV